MEEFWDSKFREIGTSWGIEPANSAIEAFELFKKEKAKEILIPGIGYGRNAKIFAENGMEVTGIEISGVAIELAESKGDKNILIHHGSVTDMPFDDRKYDGIFCYSLIHLLNKNERKMFLRACYDQLKANGYMIFIATSCKNSLFGKGRKLSKNRFEVMKGLKVYFYDPESAANEFKDFGLVIIDEFDESVKHMSNEPPMKFIRISCKKI
jgi:2-polyprenyl-3-methyl-5-hydroxy-6-metoxy-1,4-benzoquinol methylase